MQPPDNQSKYGTSKWWLVTLAVSLEASDIVSSLLFDYGSTGIVTLAEDPKSVTLGGYFENQSVAYEVPRLVESELSRIGQSDAIHDFFVSEVPQEDWMHKWKEGFEAIEIGEKLIVAPSWKLPKKTNGRVIVQIDPGMAFGTGTHETTRLCLEALERHWRGGSLLDVGTGTGILAIAAAKLRSGSRVVAIDTDPHAVAVAKENAEINGIPNGIEFPTAQLRNLADSKFDIVVANLTAEVIVELMPDLVNCAASEGLMIFSGILTTLVDDVRHSLSSAGLTVIEHNVSGEWTALVALKSLAFS